MRTLPFARQRELPVDGVLAIEKEQQAHAALERIAPLEDLRISRDQKPQDAARNQHARNIGRDMDHSRLCPHARAAPCGGHSRTSQHRYAERFSIIRCANAGNRQIDNLV